MMSTDNQSSEQLSNVPVSKTQLLDPGLLFPPPPPPPQAVSKITIRKNIEEIAHVRALHLKKDITMTSL